ncbi:hypothetical protein VdG1_00999 [Verticillium dahliae VDG1]|nr:hypothetical protein VdG1_00999 [Verticillium dahliae VDG1]
MFPTWFESNYNYNNVIADFTVREVLINSVASTAFEVNGDPRPENLDGGWRILRECCLEWGVSWNIANFKATNPAPDFPGLWLLVVEDADLYRQIVYELDEYVVPSHHHHDHIWGIKDYVKAGAKVLTVDIASDYYSAIPRDKFVTYR